MAFFFCLSSMAQVVLGDINFSLKEGGKINPATGKITVTFPNVTGVADPAATNFVLAGSFAEGLEFDEVSGSFASGVTFDLAEFELQPATAYTLKIASVKVDGTELAPAEGYSLNFKTRGTERRTSWTFQLDQDSKDKIVADDGNNPDVEGAYWKCIKADERHFIHQTLKDSEIMLDADNILPMSEDLTFTANPDQMFVGDVDGKFKGLLVFNATKLRMTIPDCKVGDVITFNGVNATKGNESKQTCIWALNGGAIAPDGLVSSTGLQDSIWVSADGKYKFEVQVDGDLTFQFGNFRMRSITISEAQEKKPCKYNVIATYQNTDMIFVLKELVPETEGMTGTTVKAQFPYWLADEGGNVYQHSAISKEFNASFELNSDTTFVMEYNATDYDGCVFLSEGEDLPNAVLCTNGNAAIRSSMGKSGYVLEDQKLTTLQPGSYKIRAIVFDAAKTPGYICTLYKGAEDTEENEIYFTATATNWTECESDLLVITEPTDITLKAGGGDDKGLDVILIYASEDAPEVPGDVNGDGQVGIGDIISVTNYMAGEFNGITLEQADVNLDGEVGIGDIITITNIMAGEE